jgi:hypothetical protein
MCISKIDVSSVMLRPKNIKIRNNSKIQRVGKKQYRTIK